MAGKSKKQKLCFVVGPIGADDSEERIHADWLLEEIIQPVMDEVAGFEVKRADQIAEPGLIDSQIIDALLNADLVIGDLSTLNPNVFYEIGIRHMAQKPIVHMHLEGESIPFDVSLYRSIKFSRARPRDLRAARADLKRAVEAVLAEGYEAENPVTKARGRIELEQRATPEQRVILSRLEAIEDRLAASGSITSLTNVIRNRLAHPQDRPARYNVRVRFSSLTAKVSEFEKLKRIAEAFGVRVVDSLDQQEAVVVAPPTVLFRAPDLIHLIDTELPSVTAELIESVDP